ncbi:hypothetical protein [Actinomadura hibisca]|uniref:hypothetical protein n=1 Tax=Actinomadura hibisca TaxID=68565 RepID=UPI00082F3C23|nr:hypothetical protein [Actinomadura hibisca]
MPPHPAPTAPPTADTAAVKASLREQFPGWQIIPTDRGRWWGVREPLPIGDDGAVNDHGQTSVVIAETPDELRERLAAADPRPNHRERS